VAEAETASRQTGLGNNPDVRALALMAIMMFFQAPPVVTPESLRTEFLPQNTSLDRC